MALSYGSLGGHLVNRGRHQLSRRARVAVWLVGSLVTWGVAVAVTYSLLRLFI